ncbi:phosphodiesterase YaeI [Posidoniimonas corsicana]|uniref:Phosphodiesterase YaeI n=1 Tax=Posidoniimonas corsicana TaxID=1938618 RepID=A0A5C5VG21_9BACT|nr:metallophosphoesterase [Posidoniimonas corsicana]TWT37516.1 phosphodiesterase YaeI [Posidoniimonas corsicana]
MPPIPLLVFVLLALVGHVVFWVGFVNRTHACGWNHRVVDALTMISAVALAGVPLWAAWLWAAGGWPAVRQSTALAAYAWVMAPLTVLSIVHQVWLRLHPERRTVSKSVTAERIDFRPELGLGIANPVPRAFCRLPGNQVLTLSVERLTLGLPRLPGELAGLKIALLADLHMSGRFGIELYQKIIEQANAWRPDLVILAGDLVEKDHCTPWVADTYGRLTAPLGVHYVLGNHDKKCDHAAVRRALDAVGAVDVSRQAAQVEHNNHVIQIAGNELPWFGPPAEFTDPGANADPDLRLVVAHNPDQFGWAVERGADLMLAGHNHGGQVQFPPLGPVLTPSLHGTRYACGTFRRGDTIMHVTRGTGSLAPFRYFCPPELTLITLEQPSS